MATPLAVHHHSETLEGAFHISGSAALKGRVHKRGRKPKLLHKQKQLDKGVVAERKTHFHDPTSASRAKHPMFHFGQRLIHNAKVLLHNVTSDDGSVGASDSFVIANHEAKLIVKGHSDYLRRMQRHAGPDICLAKARSLLSNKLDVGQMCRSLLCTAVYTLAYTVGLRHELPTPGCQMIQIPEDAKQDHHKNSKMDAKSEKSEKLLAKSEKFAKSKKSEKSDFVFFCNAKYPKLIPSVLLESGFAPVSDVPGFWMTNSTLPQKLTYPKDWRSKLH